jgi:hypothetical protein
LTSLKNQTWQVDKVIRDKRSSFFIRCVIDEDKRCGGLTPEDVGFVTERKKENSFISPSFFFNSVNP